MAEDLKLKERPIASNSQTILSGQTSDGETWVQLPVSLLLNWAKQAMSVASNFFHIVNGDGTSVHIHKDFERKNTQYGEAIIIPLVPRAIDKVSDFSDFKGVVRCWIPAVVDGDTFEHPFNLATMGKLPIFVSWVNADNVTIYSSLCININEYNYKRAYIKDLYGKCFDFWFDGSFRPSQFVINGIEDNIGQNSGPIPPTSIDPFTEDDHQYLVTEETPEKLLVKATGEDSEIVLQINGSIFTQNKSIQATIDISSYDVDIDGTTYEAGQTVTMMYNYALNAWTVTATQSPDAKTYTNATVEESQSVNVPLTVQNGLFYVEDFSEYFSIFTGDIFLKNQSNPSQNGIYNIWGDDGDFTVLEKVAEPDIIETVKVKNGTEAGKWFSRYNGDDIATLSYTKMPSIAIAKTATLIVANWNSTPNANGYCEYTIEDDDIIDNTIIDFSPTDNTKTAIWKAASVLPSGTGAVGSFVLEAEAIPTENLSINYTIIEKL